MKRATLPQTNRSTLQTANFVSVSRAGATPLYQQIYQGIKQQILDGTLLPGTYLLSSRELSRELLVSRNTVQLAYDQLAVEGFISASRGSGTFVLGVGDEESLIAQAPSSKRVRNLEFPKNIQKIIGLYKRFPRVPPQNRPFRPSIPAYDRFPVEQLAKISASVWRDASASLLGYGDSAGYYPLRQLITEYVLRTRGIVCSPRK